MNYNLTIQNGIETAVKLFYFCVCSNCSFKNLGMKLVSTGTKDG